MIFKREGLLKGIPNSSTLSETRHKGVNAATKFIFRCFLPRSKKASAIKALASCYWAEILRTAT